MSTSYSVGDCSSTSIDSDAPSWSVPLAVDVCDSDGDDADTESSNHVMTYDELYEILSRLPAKSAIKNSSSLCKMLCNIHSEPRFIKKQCINSYGQDNGFFLQRMVKTNSGDQMPNVIEFHVLPWQTKGAFGIPRRSLDYLPKQGRILSSSNGLLLLGLRSRGGVKFKVCNPATRVWAPLDTPEGFEFLVNEDFSPLIECYPRGHCVLDDVEFPNDYTIAFPVHEKQLLIFCNGKWEEELCDVSIDGRLVSYDTPVGIFSDSTKGLVVHYLCNSDNNSHAANILGYVSNWDPVYMEPYIAAFDLREKKLLRKIRLPKGAWDMSIDRQWYGSHRKLWIFKWNESICLVRWRRYWEGIKAWVLDNYGSKRELWRLITVDLGTGREVELPTCLGVANNGKGLLIATANRIFVYVMEGEHQGSLEVVGRHRLGSRGTLTFLPYANTLRPVSLQNTGTFTY